MTSARVVAGVKKIFRVKKVGHTGTLDPFATGVMVCCINKATRLSRFFLHGPKKYTGVLRLGVETDSFDATGNITATCSVDVNDSVRFSDKKIRAVFRRFQGPIEQLPPVYSALKHKGVPLYKLARKGTPVQKPSRRVTIFDLNVIDIDLPAVKFEVACSAGTYIRALCNDIGTALGCGGHLKELRRIESCGFTIDKAVTLQELEKLMRSGRAADRIIGMSTALSDMQKFVADHALIQKIRNGMPFTLKDGFPLPVTQVSGSFQNHIKVVDSAGRLVAVLSFDPKGDKFNYCCVFNN